MSNLRDRGYSSSMDNYVSQQKKKEERKAQEASQGPVSVRRANSAGDRAVSANLSQKGFPSARTESFYRSPMLQKHYGTVENYLAGKRVTPGGFSGWEDDGNLLRETAKKTQLTAFQEAIDKALQKLGKTEKTFKDATFPTAADNFGITGGKQMPYEDFRMSQALGLKTPERQRREQPALESFQREAAGTQQMINQYNKLLQEYTAEQMERQGKYQQMRDSLRPSEEVQKDIDEIDREIVEWYNRKQSLGGGNITKIVGDGNRFRANGAKQLQQTWNDMAKAEECDAVIEEMIAQRNLLTQEQELSEMFAWVDMADQNVPVSVQRAQKPGTRERVMTGKADLDEQLQAINEQNISAANIDTMTDSERDVYLKLKRKFGAKTADKYYNWLEATHLNTRRAMEEKQALRDWMDKSDLNYFAGNALSVLMNPLKVFSFVGQTGEMLLTGKMTKDAEYNMFSYLNDEVRNKTSQDIYQKLGENWGKYGAAGYQTGMSILDFLFNTAITGNFGKNPTEISKQMGLILMSSEAAPSAVMEAKERGLPDNKAYLLGIIAAGAEYITETISLETLLNKVKAGAGAKEMLWYALKNRIAEASEEGAADIINLVADILISKDKSQWETAIRAYEKQGYSANEAFQKALMDQAEETGFSMLGGWLSGGVMSNMMLTMGGIENYNANRELLMNPQSLDEIVRRGMESEEGSGAYRAAQSLREKLEAKEDVSFREARNAAKTIDTQNRTGETYVRDLIKTAGEYNIDLAKGLESQLDAGEPASIQDVNKLERQVNEAQGTSEETLRPIIEQGKLADKDSKAYAEAVAMEAMLRDGDKISLNQAERLRELVTDAWEQAIVSKSAETIGRNLLTEQMRPALEQSIDYLLATKRSSQAYKLGQTLLNKLNGGEQITAREAGEAFLQAEKVASGDIGIRMERNLQPREVTPDMDEQERSAAIAGISEAETARVRNVAKVLGRRVLFEAVKPENGRVENGHIRDDGTIIINAYGVDPVMQVLSHEVTHDLEMTETYQTLAPMILDRIENIDEERARLEKLYGTDNREKIDKELVAFYVQENLLQNERAIYEVVNQSRSFGQWMLDKIDDLLAKLGNENAKERAFLRKARRLYAKALQEKGAQRDGEAASYTEISRREDQNLRDRIRDIEDQLDLAQFNGLTAKEIRQLNGQLYKAQSQLDQFTAKQRGLAKKTSINEIIRNIERYDRMDLESLAEQVSDSAWDDYEELSDAELRDELFWTLKERFDDMEPGDADKARYGFYVKPPQEKMLQLPMVGEKYSYSETAETDETDRAYLAALNKGDMETAQKMVDEAAKKAGYDTGYVVYRGDSKPYNILKSGLELDEENDADYNDDHGNLGNGLYFTPDRAYAERFAGRNGVVRKFYLKSNMADLDNADIKAIRAAIKTEIEDEWGNFSRDELYERLMDETGTNGIKATGVGGFSVGAREAIVRESWQAKLADPVTYDDDGKVIPLSERFNPGDEDIRYSYAEDEPQGLKLPGTDEAELNNEGFEVRQNAVAYNLTTLQSSDVWNNKKKVAKQIAKTIKVSQKKAERYLDAIQNVGYYIAANRERLDYESAPGLSAFVGNVEYGGSFDFTTLCAKRRYMTGTISAIQKQFARKGLTADEILTIRKMLEDAGYQVSCPMCYVEGSRVKLAEYAQRFIKNKPDLTVSQLTDPDMLETLRKEDPETYNAWESYLNKLNQRKPKMYQSRTAYNGEIIEQFTDKNGNPDAASIYLKNQNGGIRFQSFSDFEAVHLLDMMQAVVDMARVGLNGQAYTKMIDMVMAMGGTGLKINMSLVAKGVDQNGKLILDETAGMSEAEVERARNAYSQPVEGMDEETRLALRDSFSKNVGTIIVVFDDAQLRAAMADDRIDFIIPYHRSQWAQSQHYLMGMPLGVQDYTIWQNERNIKDDGKPGTRTEKNLLPNQYWGDFRTGKEAAEHYLWLCAQEGITPKFASLLKNNGDGSYSLQENGSTDGYWKLLSDYKMYDNEGRPAPQEAVRPLFDETVLTDILDREDGSHKEYPVAEDIVEKFLELKKNSKRGEDIFAKYVDEQEGPGAADALREQYRQAINRRPDAQQRARLWTKDAQTQYERFQHSYSEVPETDVINEAINPRDVKVEISEALDGFMEDVTGGDIPGREKVSTGARKPGKLPVRHNAQEAARFFYRKAVDSGEAVGRLGRYSGDRNLYHYYNMARASSNAAVSMIQDAQTNVMGEKVGDSLNDIFKRIRGKGEEYYADLQTYLYHLHNVERMSRRNPAAIARAQEELEQFRADNPEIAKLADYQIERIANDPISINNEDAKAYTEILTRLRRAEMTQNKPVFGDEVTAAMSVEASNQLAEKLKKVEGFEEDVQAIYDYIDNLMRYRVESGLITEDDAKKLKEIYPHYVPTFRVWEKANTRTRQKNKTEIGRTVGRAEGGDQKLMPLHQSLAKQTFAVVREGSKNRFGQRMLNMQKASKGMILEVSEYDGDFNEDTFDQPEAELPKKDNLFVVREDGKRWEMILDNGMYEAVKALSPDPEETNWLTKIARGSNNLFKELCTGYNPTFLVRNFMRDLQDAGLYSKDLSEFAKQYPQTWKEIAQNGKYWQMYKALGGLYSSIFDYQTGELKKGRKGAGKVLEKVEWANMAVEQAPRLAEFMATIKKAERAGNLNMDTLMEAMYNAADVTVNFGRSGQWGKFLNRNVVPFLNPGIQGFDKMMRTVTETKGFKDWARLAAKSALLGIAPAVISRMLFGKRRDWDEIKQRDKDIYYLFPLKDGVWLKLPKGRVLSIFGMAADRAMQGKDAKWGSFFTTSLQQTAPANPFENNIVQPLLETKLFKPGNPGTTWYGTDIENQRLRNLAPEERYDASTDALSKWLGKVFKLSPKKINYLLDQYSGVLGDILLPLTSDRAEKDLFTAAFTVDSAMSNQLNEDFYRRKDELTWAKNDPDATEEDKELYKYWDKLSEAVSEINSAIRSVEEDDSLSDKEKQELTRVQYQIRNEVMRMGLDALKEYESGEMSESNPIAGILREARAQEERESKTYSFKGENFGWEELSGIQKKIVLSGEAVAQNPDADLTDILGKNNATAQARYYQEAREAGISNQQYIDALTAVDDVNNGDSKYTTVETQTGLDQAISDGKITEAEAKKLWPILSGGSEKNNPYSDGALQLPKVEDDHAGKTYTFKGKEMTWDNLSSRQQKIVTARETVSSDPGADLTEILLGKEKNATKLAAGYQEAREAGISNETYLLALTAFEEADNGDGNYTQKAEVNPALQKLVDEGKLTEAEAKIIWKAVTQGADKNNPYKDYARPKKLRLPRIG